jgi:hypothetical protein
MTSMRQKDKHEEGKEGPRGTQAKKEEKTETNKISPKNKKLAEEVE